MGTSLTGGGGPGAAAGKSGQPAPVTYRMHPGVAAAVTAQAGQAVREAADAGLAAFWEAVSEEARERESGEDSGVVVGAGLAAAPYLLRRGDWNTAGFLLEHAVLRDGSPGTVAVVLPSLRQIAAATGAPRDAFRVGRVLAGVDAGEAERLLRGAVDAAVGAGDFRLAWVTAGELVNLLMGAGRLSEALAMADQQAEFTGRAGLGPWIRLLDQGQRLQVLGRMGDHARVLAETETLRAAMAALPARANASEPANPWNVREAILNTGHASALATGEWQRCLDLNAEAVASKRQRGAGVHEVTPDPVQRCGAADPAGAGGGGGAAAGGVPAGLRGPRRHRRARHCPHHSGPPGGCARAPAGGGGPGAGRAASVLRPARARGHRDQPPQPGQLLGAAGW